LYNGDWERLQDGKSISKGTYTTHNGRATEIFTHVYYPNYDYLNAWIGFGLENRWYSLIELDQLFYDNSFDNYYFDPGPHTKTFTYSINGNTLDWWDTWTRQ